MPRFLYRAIGLDGVPQRGELVAASRSEAVVRLRAQSSVLLRVEPADATAFRRLQTDVLGRNRLSKQVIAAFMARLASLLGAGLPLEEALAIVGGPEGTAATRPLTQQMLQRLREGSSLADAMAAEPVFAPIVVGMIRAGEASGTLVPVAARLADYLQRSEAVRQAIRSALIYPAILLATAAMSILVVLTSVLPALQPLFEDAGPALPLPTRLAFMASGFVRQDWWAGLGLCVAGAVLARYALANPALKARRDRQLFRLPVLGMAFRKIEVARFARTLGALIGGGVALPTALALAHPVLSNLVLADALARVVTQVREGSGLARAVAQEGPFPELAVQLVRIGEATGRLDTMLLQVADIFDGDVRRIMDRSLALLVPLLTIGIGAVVAGIIASVMLAVLSINDLVH